MIIGMIRKRQWKDPNTRKNRMKNIESDDFVSQRWKVFNEVKSKGGSDMAGLVKALEIVPRINPQQNRKRRSQ